jgi:hypothetical protein
MRARARTHPGGVIGEIMISEIVISRAQGGFNPAVSGVALSFDFVAYLQ